MIAEMRVDQRFVKGVELFNRREFFQCHEVLEEVWQSQTGPERQFTQGVIQIAVGFYHVGRRNPTGARKLLRKGLDRISPFLPCLTLELLAEDEPPRKARIPLGDFVAGVEAVLASVEAKERLIEQDADPTPRENAAEIECRLPNLQLLVS